MEGSDAYLLVLVYEHFPHPIIHILSLPLCTGHDAGEQALRPAG